jgi:PAS domain S-box-containing protein
MLQAVNADAFTIYALRREQKDVSVLHNSEPVAAVDHACHNSDYDLERLDLARQVVATGAPTTRLLHVRPGADSGVPPAYTMTVLPLTIRDEMFGLVEMIALETDPAIHSGGFSSEQLQLLGAILNQASVALEIAHLFEELDERVARRTQALAEESERVKILLRITTELTGSLDLDRVLTLALQLVNDVVHSAHSAILLVDEESGELVIRAALGQADKLPPEGLPGGLLHDEGPAGWVIEHREAVVVGDVQEDDRWQELRPSGDRSALAVPLISAGEVLGAMILTDPRPHVFTGEQLSLVEAAAVQVANATHNASLYALIRRQADKLGVMMREAQVDLAKQQSILQSIADGVLVAEADGTIVMANPPTANILNTPRERLIGKSVNELMGLYGESGHDWVATIEEWARNPQDLEEQTSLKNHLEMEDKIVLVHVAPVFASDRYFGTISIFRDITKEVEVDRMKSEFVSTVSHELRTPMTSIKGYADLLLMGVAGALSEPQLRHLNVIRQNANRLQLLVNDLLDISRIETGKTQLDLQPVAVAQIVSAVSDHLQGRIRHEDKNLAVEIAVSPSLPRIHADPEKITRALTNLVDNAFNYTPPGGEITISASASDTFVTISVEDSGIGISQADQKNIFDRFFRAEDEEVRKVPGTGLGLAIVSSLVEMHGGELWLESELGHGSTFSFSLPRAPEAGHERQQQEIQ